MTKIYDTVFLDTETTGLSFERSRVVEVGIISDTGRLLFFQRYASLSTLRFGQQGSQAGPIPHC